MSAPAGVILAGGRARRLGGGDKCLLPLHGRPILSHVIDRVAPQCAALALNANGDPARFAGFGLPVIADTLPGQPGPLAGVLAGMEWAARLPGCRRLLTVAADQPFLPVDLVARLEGAASAGVACAASGGRNHWLTALWPLALRETLHAALVQEGLAKVEHFLDRVGWTAVDYGDAGPDPFFNINDAGDLARAAALVR